MRRFLTIPLTLIILLGVVAPAAAGGPHDGSWGNDRHDESAQGDRDDRRDGDRDRGRDDDGGDRDRDRRHQGGEDGDEASKAAKDDDERGNRGDRDDRDHRNHRSLPDQIDLPAGFAPEGIAIGRWKTFYVGSLAGAGIYRGDLRSGEGAVLVPGEGRTFTGLEVARDGRLWAAGGPDGVGYAFDTETGATLATIQLAAPGEATFVNDVVVTKRAAWFTDSMRPVLYRVPIGQDGEVGAVETIDLTGQIEFVAGEFNLNGIDASWRGKTLLVINSTTGLLYAVDPETETATEVDLGGATLPNGDGILLVGRRLYVVQNTLNQVAVVRLRHGFESGEVVRTITSDGFDVPTTIAKSWHSLYAVNARFGTAVTVETPYWVTRIGR
jgi:sugar lactone lactonase YvrE